MLFNHFKSQRFYALTLLMTTMALLSLMNAAANDEGTSDNSFVSNLFTSAFSVFRLPLLPILELIIDYSGEYVGGWLSYLLFFPALIANAVFYSFLFEVGISKMLRKPQ